MSLEEVSVEDNFFEDLGAHSLLMAQLSSALRERLPQASLSMREIYLNPTVAKLAEMIDTAAAAADEAEADESEGRKSCHKASSFAYLRLRLPAADHLCRGVRDRRLHFRHQLSLGHRCGRLSGPLHSPADRHDRALRPGGAASRSRQVAADRPLDGAGVPGVGPQVLPLLARQAGGPIKSHAGHRRPPALRLLPAAARGEDRQEHADPVTIVSLCVRTWWRSATTSFSPKTPSSPHTAPRAVTSGPAG